MSPLSTLIDRYYLPNTRAMAKTIRRNFQSHDLLSNPNVLNQKLICYCMSRGLKLKAYKIYVTYMDMFFSMFREFTPQLMELSPLYNMHYSYAQKNLRLFFSALYIYKNISAFLEPTFILTTKKKKTRKRQTSREIYVSYVQPSKRIPLCIRLVNLYSRTYRTQDSVSGRCYGLLLTFLLNKNSTLFKKKIYTYNKLLQQRRLLK